MGFDPPTYTGVGLNHTSMCNNQTLNRLHSVFCSSLNGSELFNFNHKYISAIYLSWRKIIRRIFRVPYRTHNGIAIKLRRLNRGSAKFLFSLINHNNTDVKYITIFKINCPCSALAQNYKYLLYKYIFFAFRLLFKYR